VVKRRHGLDPCRYTGIERRVALGVIADNMINIFSAMEKQSGL